MIRSHFVLYWWNFKSYNIPFKSFWSPLFIHLEAQSVSSEIIFFSSLLLILYVFTDVVSRHCFLYLVFSLVFAYWFRQEMLVNIFRPSKTLYCYFFYWPWDWKKQCLQLENHFENFRMYPPWQENMLHALLSFLLSSQISSDRARHSRNLEMELDSTRACKDWLKKNRWKIFQS